ncbi:MAG: glycosyltransferase [Bosea sp. (in: a-proteobacteria)]
MGMVKRALLVSEVGAGAGHVTRLRRIAQVLGGQGVGCVAAVFKQTHTEALAPFVTHVLPAPGWPGLWGKPEAVAPRQDGSAPTYADMLIKLGLGTVSDVRANQFAWDGLLQVLQPDIIVGDYAPGAMLAAAGRMPAVAVGTGFTVPAVRDGYLLFERYLPEAEKQVQEMLFSSIAEGAGLDARAGRPTAIAALRGNTPCAASLPEFDPSFDVRAEALVPPEIDEIPDVETGNGSDLLAYCGDEIGVFSSLLPELGQLGRRIRIYAPGLATQMANSFMAAGIILEAKPFSLTEIARSGALVIHHGGLGICQLAALAGVPQLIFYRTGERWNNAQAVSRSGAGWGMPAAQADAATLVQLATRMLDEQGYRRAAGLWAQAARGWCGGQTGQQIIAARCLELLS